MYFLIIMPILPFCRHRFNLSDSISGTTYSRGRLTLFSNLASMLSFHDSKQTPLDGSGHQCIKHADEHATAASQLQLLLRRHASIRRRWISLDGSEPPLSSMTGGGDTTTTMGTRRRSWASHCTSTPPSSRGMRRSWTRRWCQAWRPPAVRGGASSWSLACVTRWCTASRCRCCSSSRASTTCSTTRRRSWTRPASVCC